MKPYKLLDEFKFLSSLGVSLVVLGHALIYLDGKQINDFALPGILLFLRNMIYGFHLPLFVFVAGYLFRHTNNNVEKIDSYNFLSKKAKRLLVPYVIISSIAFVPKALLANYAIRPIDLNFKDYAINLLFPFENTIIYFWYLPTLFLLFLLFVFIRNSYFATDRVWVAASITISCLLAYLYNPFSNNSLFNFSGAIDYAVYFCIGYFFCVYREKIDFINDNAKSVFVISLACLIVLTALKFNGIFFALKLFKFIFAVTGIIFSYSLAIICTSKKMNFLKFIEGYTYQIFILSWFFISFSRIICYQILGVGFYVAFPMMFFTGLLAPIFIAKLMKSYYPKYSYVIGG